MSAVPARVLNELFTQKLGSSEGKEKMAEYGGTYIRDRLREVSYARKVIPPENVTRASVTRDRCGCPLFTVDDDTAAGATTVSGITTVAFPPTSLVIVTVTEYDPAVAVYTWDSANVLSALRVRGCTPDPSP